MIENGDKVRDRVTGFEGIVVGTCEYLTGCRQASVIAPSKDGKPAEGAWFDDDRLELLQAQAVTLPTRQRDGGPQDAPPVR